MIFHFLRGQDRPNEDQRTEHLPDAPRLLTAIDDPSMGNTPPVKSEVVVIVGDDDATFDMGEGEMLLVHRALQAYISCGGDVDAATSQRVGDRRVDMLIQVEADRRRHHGQLASGGVSKEFGAGGWWPALRLLGGIAQSPLGGHDNR